jgi:hypothetical protein
MKVGRKLLRFLPTRFMIFVLFNRHFALINDVDALAWLMQPLARGVMRMQR